VRAFAFRLFWGFPLAGLVWTGINRFFSERWNFEILYAFILTGWLIALPCILSPTMGMHIRNTCHSILRVIEKYITRISLAAAFYLAIFPFALFRRLLGKDPLLRRPRPPDSETSYWTTTTKHTTNENCHEQF
jgi:hypothetical protein